MTPLFAVSCFLGFGFVNIKGSQFDCVHVRVLKVSQSPCLLLDQSKFILNIRISILKSEQLQ